MARILVLGLAVLTLVVAAACGGEEAAAPEPETVEGATPAETDGGGDGGGEGDAAAGREIYLAQDCGSCHTLADAGTSGTIGPSLDDSSVDFEGAVAQISAGGGGMPAYEGTLSEDEIADVAAYVTQSR